MIEIYDVRDVETKLDIAPELAIAAYNTLIQFCKNHSGEPEDGVCKRCVLYGNCPAENDLLPEDWKELHFPRRIGNTIEHLKDGEVHRITCGNRAEAEALLCEMEDSR